MQAERYELTEEQKQSITKVISRCYNQVVTDLRPSFAAIEPFDLFFVLSIRAKDSRFKASVYKLADCRFVSGEPSELPGQPLYAASFDFLHGMMNTIDQERMTPRNEVAILYIHDVLTGIFDKLTLRLIEEMNKNGGAVKL